MSFIGKYQWNDYFRRNVPRIFRVGLSAKWDILDSAGSIKERDSTFHGLHFTTFLNLAWSHSFKVECLFGADGAQTLIHPVDWPEKGFIFPANESQRCSTANCYKKEVAYVPFKTQIKSLMALSSDCTQKVTHTCNANGLTGVSSWIDSNGTTNSYWHGYRNSGNFQ